MNNTFTITLNEQQMETLEHLLSTRTNKTAQQVVEQMVERGMYQLDYRSMRNKAKYAEEKGMREELKALKAALKG